MRRVDLIVVLAAAASAAPAFAEEGGGFLGALTPTYTEFYGKVEAEGLLFAEEGLFPEQDRAYLSFALQPTLYAEWLEGDLSFRATPFLRLDPQDDERTHFDFRDLKFTARLGERAELTFGADIVFWGKTEAVHLVDIINQTDFVEGTDGEDKLGQPMIAFSYLTDDYGEFSAYYLPYFRERPFHGAESRLRLPFEVDEDDARFREGNEWSPSFAGRWSHFIGDFDVGASVFYGHNRAPEFQFTAPGVARPVYDQIIQLGFDGQYTNGPVLLKLETVARFDERNARMREEDYVAATGGVEYTFYGIGGTNADLGVIAEYAWDQRQDDATTLFENDVFGGLRLALNDSQDTSILALASADLDGDGASFRLEAERRIAESWTAALVAGAFIGDDPGDDFFAFRNDHFVRLTVAFNW